MKTLYCLGGVPQFKIPCLKYGFLIKEKENNRNLFAKNHSIDNKDFYNIKKGNNEIETIADKYIDEIFPSRGIKRCLQINQNIQIRMKNYFKNLKRYLSFEKNKINTMNEKYKENVNNYENGKSHNLNNSNDNGLQKMKLIFGNNNPQNNLTLFNRKVYNNESILSYYKKEKKLSTDFPIKNKHSRNILEPSIIDLSPKLYNYNYNFQISKESSSVDILQLLYKSLKAKKRKKRDKNFITISNDNSLKNDFRKQIIYNNESILSYYKKEKKLKTDFPSKNNHSRNILEPSIINLSPKLYNYNYNFQISKDSSSVDLLQLLYKSLKAKNRKKRDKNFITISNDNSLKNYFRKQIIYNNKYLRYLHNKKNSIEENNIKNIKNTNTNSNKLNKTSYKETHIQLESPNINSNKIDQSNSIEKIKFEIKKRKRKSGRSKTNKLNILYSETEDQFYVKYEKYRKSKFLKGLCLTNIDSSPKIKFNKLDKKIDLIKNKVDVLKSIADKTFPKVLANITSIKNEFDNNIRKRKYDKPYIEKLNEIIKEQNNMNSYLSKPIEIRSHKTISENNKLN